MKKYITFIYVHTIPVIRWAGLVALLYIIVESVSLLALVYIQRNLIDQVFVEKQYDLLPTILSIFGLTGLIYALMFIITSRRLVKNEFAVSHALLRKLLVRMENLPIARFNKERTGKYVQSLTHELFHLSSFLGYEMPRGLQNILQFLLLVVVIGIASPLLLLLVLVMCAIYILTAIHFMPKLKGAAKRVAEKQAVLLTQIEEGVASTREVVAYHRMEWESKLFQKMFGEYFDEVMAEGKVVNKQMNRSDPLKWGIGLLVLAFGGYQLINGQMSPGTFVIVFQFAVQLSDSCYYIFQFFMRLAGQLAYMDRIQLALDTEQRPKAEKRLEGPITTMSIEKISFRYAENLPEVIHQFSAQLPIGRKIAFVGTSGGGKSTIAQLLIRFYQAQQGDIKVNNVPLSQIDYNDWSNKITIVFQDPYLFSDTIRENLMLGRKFVNEEDMIEACRIAQIHTFIEQLSDGYNTNIGERGIKLSGGQRQRIAIARAILGNPEILVLDEATSALDLETERLLLSALEEKRKGLTTIMIAHRLSTIENADIIFVMDNGALAEQGTHHDLMRANGVYCALLSAQPYTNTLAV
ncbi:ABC transporter ATP-binding protein [Paenibacillus sp. GSMTC-2017]|uniref:ABC transporter ATP-binding protein n=1 Tax=Paenibacillus sp. GSMTC-2017 TaxID=2794350 RepID=UPI0018D9ECE8|nr:ABC transporter ATP-binding protein [Paenibacillus sp. GSMTC-2017]MBH5320750.1 ABC transporter ATP-binding protein [Paenibacillus sp. GSMTC-2017]